MGEVWVCAGGVFVWRGSLTHSLLSPAVPFLSVTPSLLLAATLPYIQTLPYLEYNR